MICDCKLLTKSFYYRKIFSTSAIVVFFYTVAFLFLKEKPKVDPPGIEPGTPVCKTGVLPLDYRPNKKLNLIAFFNLSVTKTSM